MNRATVRPRNNFAQPNSVVVIGDMQRALGCNTNWSANGTCTRLEFIAGANIWRGTFTIPAGNYEYKIALNGDSDENYGDSATLNGDNITLRLSQPTTVTFYYDHFTHWVADDVNQLIVIAPGSFNSELGCTQDQLSEGGDWEPGCLNVWMQDPDQDGVYTYATMALPIGDYEMKVTIGLSWDINYGADGESGGANIPFTILENNTRVVFAYDSVTNMVYVKVGNEAVKNK